MENLQHLNSSNCVIDSQDFETEDEMEEYIDNQCLPLWEEGDSITCNGVRRSCFDNYED